jgi:hypothetical protein
LVLGQIAGGQPPGPHQQLVVGAADAFLAGGQPGQHPLDPLGLLGPGEPVRDEHHDPLAVPVCGHRPAAALAAPHFHDRLARPGHYRLARPGFGFTLRR